MLHIVQVGMGGWGRDWMRRVISQNRDVEVVAWVETQPQVLEIARKELDLPEESTFTDLAEVLASVECDAVLVTASLPGHTPSALTALKAGKHVLVEKPFAPSIAEALEVVQLAEQQQLVLMVSQNYRFFPAIQAVRELLRSGEMGRVGNVHLSFRKYFNIAPRGKQANYDIWQPLLADMSIHHFDLLRYVLGQEPTQVFCQSWNPSWSKYREAAAAVAAITFQDGTVVKYDGNWASTATPTLWSGEWHIECSEGEIIMRSRDDKVPDYLAIRMRGEQEPQVIELPTLPEKDRLGSLHAFVQSIHSGQEPVSSGRDNLQTLALMFAAIESAERGVPIKL